MNKIKLAIPLLVLALAFVLPPNGSMQKIVRPEGDKAFAQVRNNEDPNVSALKRALGKFRDELARQNFPLDIDTLAGKEWRAAIQEQRGFTGSLVSKRLNGDRLQGVTIAGTLYLPERLTLAGDTFIFANKIVFEGKNVVISGSHILVVYPIQGSITTEPVAPDSARPVYHYPVETPAFEQEFFANNRIATGSVTVNVTGLSGPQKREKLANEDAVNRLLAKLSPEGINDDGAPGAPGNPGTPGSVGSGGSAGSAGANGSCPLQWDGQDGTNGSNGGNANDGTHGGDGGDGGDGGYVFYLLTAFDSGIWNFSAKGGNGGSGGSGGVGGHGGNGGDGGNGGNGGTGGDGGNGGIGGLGGVVYINYEAAFSGTINTDASGGIKGSKGNKGSGGAAGSAGTGGAGGTGAAQCGKTGFAGNAGANGTAGSAGAAGNDGAPGVNGADGFEYVTCVGPGCP